MTDDPYMNKRGNILFAGSAEDIEKAKKYLKDNGYTMEDAVLQVDDEEDETLVIKK